MSYSYDIGLSQPKDKVRLLISDTDADKPLLQNEEIQFFLDESSDSVYAAASLAATAISGRFASAVDKQVGDLRISYSQTSKQYADLAASLAGRAGSEGAPGVAPYVGGMSEAERETDANDTTIRQPAFRVGQFDYVFTDPSVRHV